MTFRNSGRAALAFAALSMITATPVVAATASGDFAARGAGTASCAAYTDVRTRKAPEVAAFMSYIDGYLSAANRYEVDTYDLTPFHNQAMLALILDKYCKEHAQDIMAVAALRLTAAVHPLRLTQKSTKIQVVDGANRVMVYEAILQKAQAELTRKGLYKGQADGKYSPAVKTALVAFQKQSKLPESGVPDPATLWLLLNP